MQMYCFYHAGDFDGKCSGAIVKLKHSNCTLYGLDYSLGYEDFFPWDIIRPDDIVYMIDFSLSKEDMIRLNNSCNLIWIDHHINIMNQLKDIKIDGIRTDLYAACQLTWKYLFPNKKMPRVIELLGKYDIWDHKDPDVLPFQMGLKLYDLDPELDFNRWKKLFYPTIFFFPYYKRFIDIGKYIIKYQNTMNEKMIKNTHEVEFEGYKCIALNVMYSNKLVFNSLKDVYDIKILYYNNGNKWTYSLYSNDNSKIDVSEIAKKYGGGGHFHASGFTVNRLLF